MGMKGNRGQSFLLHGSTGMRVESRDRVGDRSERERCGRFVFERRLFLHVEMSVLKRTMKLESF